MFRSIKKIITKFFQFLWSLFLNGLLTTLPLVITIVLFNIFFSLIKGWFVPLYLVTKENLMYKMPQLEWFFTIFEKVPQAEVVFVILVIFLIGTILKILFMRSLVNTAESLIFKVPLIRPVYSGIKQLVQAFSLQDKLTFKKVVLIEFPRKGLYSLGFLTSKLQPEIAPNKFEKFFNVFVPTTPNPTSGYFIIIPEKDITIINITRQEAMALIISGGIIQPEQFTEQSHL